MKRVRDRWKYYFTDKSFTWTEDLQQNFEKSLKTFEDFVSMIAPNEKLSWEMACMMASLGKSTFIQNHFVGVSDGQHFYLEQIIVPIFENGIVKGIEGHVRKVDATF